MRRPSIQDWTPPKLHTPHAQQAAYYYGNTRYVCLCCGRGSGKTATALRKLVSHAMADHRHEVNRYAYMGPTRDQAKQTAWDVLKSLVHPTVRIGEVSESDLTIQVRCNRIDDQGQIIGQAKSIIQVIGLDRPKRAEGRHDWEGIIIDECSDIKPSTFDLSIQPSLMHRKTWVTFSGIPKRTGCGSAWYKALCEKGNLRPGDKGHDPDLITYSWPSKDIIDPAELDKIRNSPNLDEKGFREQYEASWEVAGGAAFYAFATEHIQPVAYDPTQVILLGVDFNVSFMGWVLGHSPDGKSLHVFQELFIRDTNTQEALDRLYDSYLFDHQIGKHRGGWHLFGDATSQARHSSASASDYAQLLNDKRFKFQPFIPAGNPPVMDRLASCNSLMRNAAGDTSHFRVDSRCQRLITDLASRGLDDKGKLAPGASDSPIGHLTDSLGYIIHTKFPSTLLTPSGSRKVIITAN